MSVRDFAMMFAVCAIWAVHTVVSKLVVSEMNIPPLFYAAVRFCLVAAVALPWLLPVPRPYWRMALVGFLMGGGGFALFFVGIKTATPSGAAIVSQLGMPMTTLLSVIILGEVIRWRRMLGILLAFAGILIVMWDPAGLTASSGLLFIAASSLLGALGAVLMKQIDGVHPMRFQAWVGLASAPPLILLSAGLESDQIALAQAAGWPFVAAVLFSALVVSILAHSLYYVLIARHDANVVAPLMVMNPLMAVALGILITGDPFDLRMAAGAAIALTGVLIITLRKNQVMPLATLLWQRWR